MTEILSKEKEFLKLNEQLNRLAAGSTANGHSSQSPSGASDVENRFLTYQKTKGQSTILRKRGAGDGLSGAVEINATTTTKTTLKERANFTPRADVNRHCARRREYAITSPRAYHVANRHSPASSSNEQNTSKFNTGTLIRKPVSRVQESYRTKTHTQATRTSNSRIPPTNTSTFTVRYRNPNFVKSPSLELIARSQCAGVRNQIDEEDAIYSRNAPANDLETASRTLTIEPRKSVSTEALIKYLKSKISLLEEDHARLTQDMEKQKEQLDKSVERSKILEQQRDLAINKQNSLQDQLAKVEAQLDEASQLNKDSSKEQLQLQKEIETAKRDLKIMSQNNNNLDKRLNRAIEDLEAARKVIATMKAAEKEEKERTRQDFESKEKQVTNLKKQRADLLNAYKKQLFLIDNLKRQTVCLEQAQMLSFGEKEFSKVLDWGMKS